MESSDTFKRCWYYRLSLFGAVVILAARNKSVTTVDGR
jgi:hypothetical protein